MDEEILLTDSPDATGGFWGDDGFTFDDLGSVIELGADTANTLGGFFGWNTDQEYEETAPGYYEPVTTSTAWYWWVAGGILLLLIIVLVYTYVIKKQGKK